MKRQAGYLLIGLAIALALSAAASLWLWKALDSARADKARIKGEYDAFVVGVKDAGTKAEKDKAAALKLQKENHDAAIDYWTGEHVALLSKYDRMRNAGAGKGSGGGAMPAVPDAARPGDDAARDKRLLDVLQYAEKQTGQLIALQKWVTDSKDACGSRLP